MKKIFILLVATLFLSCNQNTRTNQAEKTEPNTEIQTGISESLDWLIGDWERINHEEESFERWEKMNLSEYMGMGFTIFNGDTIMQELMQIIESDGKWKLLVKTPDDDGAGTAFEMTELKANEFVFTNESIDFPKRIHYWMEGENLKAKISNEEMEIPFDFERIK